MTETKHACAGGAGFKSDGCDEGTHAPHAKRRKQKHPECIPEAEPCRAGGDAVCPPAVPPFPPAPAPSDVCIRGRPLPAAAAARLLRALRCVNWPEGRIVARKGVKVERYCTLGRSSVRSNAAFDPGGHVWEAVAECVDALCPSLPFTQVALAKNFRGSPHVDKRDVTWQLALAVGTGYTPGTARLCFLDHAGRVTRVDTLNRAVRCDGRFPHWVDHYAAVGGTAERYSVIVYCTAKPHATDPVCPVDHAWLAAGDATPLGDG